MTGWDAVGARYGTDKSSIGHDYLRCYETVLAGRDVRSVVEVGVDGGRSLLTWATIWPDAVVWGVEINPPAATVALADDPAGARCTVLVGDATTPDTVALLPDRRWDLIVDDGSHQFYDQVQTLRLLTPLLADGGFYVVEDVPWSDAERAHPGDVDRMLVTVSAFGLRPVCVAWSALRNHAAVIAERRP